jgi:3-hydroxyacyl-CoA dehydrogenase
MTNDRTVCPDTLSDHVRDGDTVGRMVIPNTIGVVGAGQMGAGIAQLVARAGIRTLLFDPMPTALERGTATIGDRRGRILDGLQRELGEERYRAAPLLRRQVSIGAGLSDR